MAAKKVSASRDNATAYKKQAEKGWKEFASWINGKDVRGGPEAQKRAAAMRAGKIRSELGPKGGRGSAPATAGKPRGGQTRRVADTSQYRKQIPETK